MVHKYDCTYNQAKTKFPQTPPPHTSRFSCFMLDAKPTNTAPLTVYPLLHPSLKPASTDPPECDDTLLPISVGMALMWLWEDRFRLWTAAAQSALLQGPPSQEGGGCGRWYEPTYIHTYLCTCTYSGCTCIRENTMLGVCMYICTVYVIPHTHVQHTHMR